jgi:hypothetical protein
MLTGQHDEDADDEDTAGKRLIRIRHDRRASRLAPRDCRTREYAGEPRQQP